MRAQRSHMCRDCQPDGLGFLGFARNDIGALRWKAWPTKRVSFIGWFLHSRVPALRWVPACAKKDGEGRVKCERSGAICAATANRGLGFLGFARNDIGALQVE